MRLTKKEGQHRWKAIQSFLKENDYAAYVVFTTENLIYTTNFKLDVDIWERPVAVIIPRDGDPSMIINELSINSFHVCIERQTCWVTDATPYVEHPRVSNRTWTRPEWDHLLVHELKRHGVARGRVAVDTTGLISPTVRGLLPDVSFSARPDVIRDLRLVKSDAEVAIMRIGGPVTNFGIAQYRELIAPGESILDVTHEVLKRVGKRATEVFPDESLGFYVSADTGVDTACPHSSGGAAGRKIQVGDSVITNVLLRLNNYWIEHERTFFVGEPSKDQRHYMTAMIDAQQAGIDAMVEGKIIADIDSAAQSVHEAAGTSDYLFHRSGHGIGIGGHEYPDDMPFNYRPLVAGMAFSCEPAVFVRGLGGFRHSDTVIVGKTKPELMTDYPKQIEEITIPA